MSVSSLPAITGSPFSTCTVPEPLGAWLHYQHSYHGYDGYTLPDMLPMIVLAGVSAEIPARLVTLAYTYLTSHGLINLGVQPPQGKPACIQSAPGC